MHKWIHAKTTNNCLRCHGFLFLSSEKDENFALFSIGKHNEGFIQCFSFTKDHDSEVCNKDKNTHNLHAVLLTVEKWFTPFC